MTNASGPFKEVTLTVKPPLQIYTWQSNWSRDSANINCEGRFVLLCRVYIVDLHYTDCDFAEGQNNPFIYPIIRVD